MRLPVVALSLIAATAAVGLTGCEKQTKAPFEQGVCMHVVEQKDGTLKFNPVAQNVASLELCAAELEGMRLRFVRLGSPNRELTGRLPGQVHLRAEGRHLSGRHLRRRRGSCRWSARATVAWLSRGAMPAQ
jgi:hypothetical protein